MLRLPDEERPRERLRKYGSEAVSTTELIAIILGSGIKNISVLELSQEILARFKTLNKLAEASLEEFEQIKGLGPAKALQLKAAITLGIRVSKQNPAIKSIVDTPLQAYYLIKDELIFEKREVFIVILLDSKSCVISHQTVSIGTLSEALVHPREVFFPAIRQKASSLILVHNHPSGDPTPSTEDLQLTQVLLDAGRIIGIPVNDHIIIGEKTFISLRQKNLLQF